jgi:hypothetical protein
MLHLLRTIVKNPHVDVNTRTRAGFLLWRISGNAIGIVWP